MGSSTEVDFSFPVHPSPTDSPPLWHLSPAASPVHCSYISSNSLTSEEYYKQRKSASNIETYYKTVEDGAEGEEEKMDLLWQVYFNEEKLSKLQANKNFSSAGGDMVELGCVRALKFSRNGKNGAIFSDAAQVHKKPSIVVFVKVLKKLFFLHNR